MRHKEIDLLVNSKEEKDRETCIVLLKEHLESAPDDIKSWYDLACCYDFLGKESSAEPCYQKAYEIGSEKLEEGHRLGFFVGYGSTLRNNQKFEESKRILNEGIKQFPDSSALKIFLALTFYSCGEHKEASESLFEMSAQLPGEVVDGYKRAIGWYVRNLDKPI